MLPFDLHVLGMPPAFNLSQDQTLHLSFRWPKPSIFLKGDPNIKRSLLTCFSWTLALLGQSFRPLQGAHTSHLRILSKINHLRLISRTVPKHFAPGEPHILHRFHLPSTPSRKYFFVVDVAEPGVAAAVELPRRTASVEGARIIAPATLAVKGANEYFSS